MEQICTSSEGLAYKKVDGGYEVTGVGSCQDSHIVVPAEYEGLPVCAIGAKAFCKCDSLISVTIPDGVTHIGERAFLSCKLLKKVVMGKQVTHIGTYAFSDCPSLTKLPIPRGVVRLDKSALYKCLNLKSIAYDGTIEQWSRISKGSYWNASTGLYVVYCTDGNLSKANS